MGSANLEGVHGSVEKGSDADDFSAVGCIKMSVGVDRNQVNGGEQARQNSSKPTRLTYQSLKSPYVKIELNASRRGNCCDTTEQGYRKDDLPRRVPFHNWASAVGSNDQPSLSSPRTKLDLHGGGCENDAPGTAASCGDKSCFALE